jgi:hypothetical protein
MYSYALPTKKTILVYLVSNTTKMFKQFFATWLGSAGKKAYSSFTSSACGRTSSESLNPRRKKGEPQSLQRIVSSNDFRSLCPLRPRGFSIFRSSRSLRLRPVLAMAALTMMSPRSKLIASHVSPLRNSALRIPPNAISAMYGKKSLSAASSSRDSSDDV